MSASYGNETEVQQGNVWLVRTDDKIYSSLTCCFVSVGSDRQSCSSMQLAGKVVAPLWGKANAVKQEPNQAVGQEPNQAVGQEPNQAVRQEPNQAVGQEPNQAVRQEPNQAVRQIPWFYSKVEK